MALPVFVRHTLEPQGHYRHCLQSYGCLTPAESQGYDGAGLLHSANIGTIGQPQPEKVNSACRSVSLPGDCQASDGGGRENPGVGDERPPCPLLRRNNLNVLIGPDVTAVKVLFGVEPPVVKSKPPLGFGLPLELHFDDRI